MTARVIAATYRLQLSKSFRLGDARRIAPYLHRLGISHVYLSPVLRSRPGSTHGYDVVDPARLDPELGGETEWRALVEALHGLGMGIVLDIVPNHMAAGSDNPYWEDLLTHGWTSRYARWFDIDWSSEQRELRGRVLLPVLGDELAAVLERGEVRVTFEHRRFRVRYFEHTFPVDPSTIPMLLAHGLDELRERVGGEHTDVRALDDVLEELESIPRRLTREPRRIEQRRSRSAQALGALAELWKGSAVAREHIEWSARAFSSEEDFQGRLRAFLDAQAYSLVSWRRAAREINYRRFFDINELVALRAEDAEVFAETHRRVLEWVADGSVDALRVDHIDGLLDPLAYLARLADAAAARAAAPVPIIVEKILSSGERLRDEWPVAGTTGYEFLNELESIFLDPDGSAAVVESYCAFTSDARTFAETAAAGKLHVLRTSMLADVQRLARLLSPLARHDRRTATAPRVDLFEALIAFIAALPVYRTYIDRRTPTPHDDDAAVIARALEAASAQPGVSRAVLDLIAETLHRGGDATDRLADARYRFTARLQQTTGPATAKGVEDTALYRWVPLVSRNEVGGDPERSLDEPVPALHRANAMRVARWPRTLLATTTHDTKRSADVRSRLDVLSERAEEWEDRLASWRFLNARHRTPIRGRRLPDRRTEYLFYQALIGLWPFGARSGKALDAAALGELRERLQGFMQKAAREAKEQTSWIDQDAAFEGALATFIDAVLDAAPENRFLADVAAFVARIERHGTWNAISRAVLHCAAPGTPDLYQGDELWNFALVDPDNRRPVDFARRERVLAELDTRFDAEEGERRRLLRELVDTPEDGRLKLHVIHRTLLARRAHPALFGPGGYAGISAAGRRHSSVVAFLRSDAGGDAAIAAGTRLTGSLCAAHLAPLGGAVWADTVLILPRRFISTTWCDVLTGDEVTADRTGARVTLSLAELFRNLPVAVLVRGE